MRAERVTEVGKKVLHPDVVPFLISAKMVRRHPNVFGDVKVESAEEGLALWKRIKSQEKSEKS